MFVLCELVVCSHLCSPFGGEGVLALLVARGGRVPASIPCPGHWLWGYELRGCRGQNPAGGAGTAAAVIAWVLCMWAVVRKARYIAAYECLVGVPQTRV
jgi:hypothetical protein